MEAPPLPQADLSTPRSKPFSGSVPKTTLQDVEVQERLNKLNHWVNQGSTGEILELMSDLNDPDERVRARAEELGGELSAKSDADDRASQ